MLEIAMNAVDKLREWKLNFLWVCIVLICALAVMSGYCVSISIERGFEFSTCR
jgi:hypothetical protein